MPLDNTTTDPNGVVRSLSFGEKAVGLTFNPSNDPQVQAVKAAYAAIIDQLNDLRTQSQEKATGEREPYENTRSSENVRLYSVAITEAQTAQMWAVKAITWQY